MGRPLETLNSLVIYKKIVDADKCKDKTPKTVAMWDAVNVCPQNEDCPLHLDCPYLPKIMERAEVAKCAIQEHYVRYVYRNLVEQNIYELDQAQLDQIGFLLLPLYVHLIKFKMIEYSLSLSNDLVGTSKMGVKTVHPIYREIRETIKNIASMSWQVGITVARKPTSVLKPPTVEDLMTMGGGMVTDDMDDTTMKPPNYRYEKPNKGVELNRNGSKKMTQRSKENRRRCKIKTVDV